MLTTSAPWHQVLTLRPDLMSGELEMAEFAADLYDVAEGRGGSVYRDPTRFFSLTYPTHNLRDLVRNVSLRLAGKGTKAVHQINVTFGGGKTHALIALYHLANDPAHLPKVDAVDEFRQHAGTDFTRARIALLPFDKIDIARGLDTRSPSGETHRWLQPWT
ncbi:MAG: AAA+ family ATPase, partial [Vulcanimicrobiaceae bacterium]